MSEQLYNMFFCNKNIVGREVLLTKTQRCTYSHLFARILQSSKHIDIMKILMHPRRPYRV